MASLPTIKAAAYLGESGTAWVTTTVANLQSDDGNTIRSGNNPTGYIEYSLDDFPVDLGTITALTVAWEVVLNAHNNDTDILYACIYDSSGVALTNEVTVASTASSTSSAAFSTITDPTNLSRWNGAKLRIRSAHSQAGAADNSYWTVDYMWLTGTYTAATSDRTASGGLGLQSPLLGGSAGNTPPARSASGGLDVQSPLLGGSATNVPPARSASGGLALQSPLLAGTATNAAAAPRDASGGLRVQSPILSGTAANTAPPRAADGSLALQSPLLAGTATNTPPARAGSGGLALQAPALSGTAANTPPARSASGGLRVQLPLLTGSATSGEVRSADGGLALGLPSLGGTATVERLASGGLALSLPSLTGDATNTPPARDAAGGLRVPLPSLGGTAVVTTAEPRAATGGLALSAPTLGGSAMQIVHAAYFDGIDDEVPLGDLGVCEDETFTLESVCRPYEADGTRYVLGESGAVARIGLGVSDGAAYARLVSDTGVVAELTGASLTDDELHYLALAADGATARLYVDGVLADSEALPAGRFTMTETTLGALASGGFWYGEVAVARLYPTALDALGIADQYEAWLDWVEYAANLDLTATLLPAGWRARVLREGWSADLVAAGWRAETKAEGWTAETLPAGWSATTRSG